MLHNIFYKHKNFKKVNVGFITVCMRRLFARNLNITIYPDGDYGNYVIQNVGLENFKKLMKAESPSELVRRYLEIIDEKEVDSELAE